MLRMAGLLLLFVIPAAIGLRAYRRLCERGAFWERFYLFLQYAETAVRYTAVPAEELLHRYRTEEKEFSLIRQSSLLCEAGSPFPEAWRLASEQSGRELLLSAEELQFLRRFGEGFGTTDTEGQLAHFQFYRERTEEKRRVAAQEKQQKGKLWLLLGALTGAGIDLLLL